MTDESFELPVTYNGEHLLPGKLVPMGYTYKIVIDVNGHEIIFEPDEERNLRARTEHIGDAPPVPTAFVRAIGEALEKNLR